MRHDEGEALTRVAGVVHREGVVLGTTVGVAEVGQRERTSLDGRVANRGRCLQQVVAKLVGQARQGAGPREELQRLGLRELELDLEGVRSQLEQLQDQKVWRVATTNNNKEKTEETHESHRKDPRVPSWQPREAHRADRKRVLATMMSGHDQK